MQAVLEIVLQSMCCRSTWSVQAAQLICVRLVACAAECAFDCSQ